MKRLIITIISIFMLQNCNSQGKTDLQKIMSSKELNVLSQKDVESVKENQEIVTKLPAYSFSDQQIENFKFGDISLKSAENSYVKILVNSISKPEILGFMVNEKNNPVLAERLNEYLIKDYGAPKIIEPEPTLKKDNIILGNSTSKWIDSKNNTSIYFYKNYLKSDGKQIIGFSLHVISNNAEYPTDLSNSLQTKKVIDWYNTRF